jgi:DNA-binding NarL/FixJ family response regulator
MSAGRRILLAVRDPRRADALRDALFRAPDIELAGIVDPTIDRALDTWGPYADILLVGADELLWLQRSGTAGPSLASSTMRVVVLLDESRILDVVDQLDHRFDLLFGPEEDRFLAERIDLAVAGYVALPASLLMRLECNQLRRRLVDDLSSDERRVLVCIGRALPNASIAAETGFAENQVKALVQSVRRKLRMKTRTSVAVFAATMHSREDRCAG